MSAATDYIFGTILLASLERALLADGITIRNPENGFGENTIKWIEDTIADNHSSDEHYADTIRYSLDLETKVRRLESTIRKLRKDAKGA